MTSESIAIWMSSRSGSSNMRRVQGEFSREVPQGLTIKARQNPRLYSCEPPRDPRISAQNKGHGAARFLGYISYSELYFTVFLP
jgi:hypothetical protein